MSEEPRTGAPRSDEEGLTADSIEERTVESELSTAEMQADEAQVGEPVSVDPVEELRHHEIHEPPSHDDSERQGGHWGRKFLILLVLVALVPLGWLGWRVQDYHTAQGQWPSPAIMKGWLSGQVEQTPFEQAWREQHQAMQEQVLGLKRQNEALADRVQNAESQNRDLAVQLEALSRRLDAVMAAQPAQGQQVAEGDTVALGDLERRLQALEQRVAEGLKQQTVAPALLQVMWDRGWYGAVAALAQGAEDRRLGRQAAEARRALLAQLQGPMPATEEKYWGGLVTVRQGGGASTRQAEVALLMADWQGFAKAMTALKGTISAEVMAAFEQFETLRREGEGRWVSSAS